ncbi:MAG TPA: DoxX family protein [Salinimicrobium sp.]|nr:DoxX family protein [Salinimicrobium sp.]
MKRLFNTQIQEGNLNIALLIIRVAIGGMMLAHGIPKLLMLFGPEPLQFPGMFGMSPALTLGLAVFAEFLCSIFIIFGLWTRLASIPLIITMVVAVFYVHVADPFSSKELGLQYLMGYVVLLLLGSGKFSIDQLIGKGKIN